MVKKIAIYGSYEARVPVRQRYWKKTTRTKKVVMDGRYEFHGSGKDLYKAVVKALQIVPKDFVDVSAEKFLKHPERYGFEGEWVEKEVKS